MFGIYIVMKDTLADEKWLCIMMILSDCHLSNNFMPFNVIVAASQLPVFDAQFLVLIQYVKLIPPPIRHEVDI